jgi:hypothetical protein
LLGFAKDFVLHAVAHRQLILLTLGLVMMDAESGRPGWLKSRMINGACRSAAPAMIINIMSGKLCSGDVAASILSKGP